MSSTYLPEESKMPVKDAAAHLSKVVSAAPDGREGDVRHDPNLKLRFSAFSMALFCFVIMSTPSAWAGSVATSLSAGGPVCMFWGFLVVFVCSLCGAGSLAEMVSIWPTAEGQIAWTEHLAPKSCARFLRYYCAWLTCIAWIFMTSSATFICSISIAAMAAACNESYVPESWHTVLIFWAVMLLSLALNIYGMRLFAMINNVAAALAIGATVSIVVILFAKNAGNFNSGEYAIFHLENATGWTSNGIAFTLGMVSAAFSILGYDSVAHLCEEMHAPAVYAPRAMIGSVLMSLPTGLIFILAVVFTIKDIDVVAQQMFPLIYIVQKATGSTGGAVFLTCALTTVSAACASMSMLATSGRVIWAFALEGGIPFSKQFSKISPRHHVPIRAMVVSCIIQMLIVLVYIGNAALFNSILVLAIALLNTSYVIPNTLMLFRGRPSGTLPKAPFTLGPILGPIANAIAILYEVFISGMLFLPTMMPVSGENMNYACAIFGGAHVLCGIYWFIGGKKRAHNFHETVGPALHPPAAQEAEEWSKHEV
ncbi:hypothetical protein JCM10450v2_005226 [Rhodotorula kratochvilovae]